MSLFRFALLYALSVIAVLAAGEPPTWPLPTTTPVAAGFSPERLARLHATLDHRVDEGKYSGYILLLARDGKIVDWSAHGWRNVNTSTPLERDSIVRLFSMTKLFTSTAALILMEEGRLKLNDPVEKYLAALKDRKVFAGGSPSAPVLIDARRPITVRDLLTHTAGYYYDFDAPGPLREGYQRADPFAAADLNDFVTRAATLPLAFQPGERFLYGINTDLLGAVIEKASGQRLDDFMAQRIFAPLGLRDTSFFVAPEKRDRIARIHQRSPAGQLQVQEDRPNENPARRGLLLGGGGLYSTAGDYVRFAQMLLNGGQLEGRRVLSRKSVELMTRNALVPLADPHPFGMPAEGFGLGVRIITDLGQSPVLSSPGCYGWDGMATTHVEIDPKERTVAILLLQHFPYNEDDIFSLFSNGYYSALVD